MTELRRQMEMNMDLENFAVNTKRNYLSHVSRFAQHFERALEDMGEEEIRTYLHHLIAERRLSQAYVSQTYSALKFLYETTLGRTWDFKRISRSKQRRKLPLVLAKEQVQAILSSAPNLKYYALFTTLYSAGLRTDEAAHLKVADIDSNRMLIRVNQGKGSKDRYTLFWTCGIGPQPQHTKEGISHERISPGRRYLPRLRTGIPTGAHPPLALPSSACYARHRSLSYTVSGSPPLCM